MSMNNIRPEYTPEKIVELKSNEIFVFGSNPNGHYGGGNIGSLIKVRGVIFYLFKNPYLCPSFID